MMMPVTMDASARLKMYQGPTSMKSVTCPSLMRSARFPNAPANIRPRLVCTQTPGVPCER